MVSYNWTLHKLRGTTTVSYMFDRTSDGSWVIRNIVFLTYAQKKLIIQLE